jgi:hypothetical protein
MLLNELFKGNKSGKEFYPTDFRQTLCKINEEEKRSV